MKSQSIYATLTPFQTVVSCMAQGPELNEHKHWMTSAPHPSKGWQEIMPLPILTQQRNDSSINPNDTAEASLHISSMCGGACWDGNLLQAPLSLSLWSSFLMEKALHCQVGFAYMMRIIGRLKWDTSVRLTSYTDWPKKCVCVAKNSFPLPSSSLCF